MTDAERAEFLRLAKLAEDEATPLAGKAWNDIRKPDDATWINLPLEIKHKLRHLAEKYVGGRTEAEGDYAPEGFFAKVQQLAPEISGVFNGPSESTDYPLADPAFMAAISEQNPILQSKPDSLSGLGVLREYPDPDVVSGDPIVDVDLRSPMEFHGLTHVEEAPEQPNPPVSE